MTSLALLQRPRLAAAVLACLLATPPALTPVRAAAPQVHAQAPGYYRLMLGDDEVTALNDGTIELDADKMLSQPAARTDAALARNWLKSPVTTSVNAFLVNTGARLMLFDTGTGASPGGGTGLLMAQLHAAGYAPEQVDDVFITHEHHDHVGGLSRDGVALFPHAVVHVGRADMDALEHQPGNPLAPYAAAQRLKAIDGESEPVPGVHAWPTPGHTPGHFSYLVESRGQRLIVTGDLIHVGAVQFDDPAVNIAWDSDPKGAAAQRQRVFALAAHDGSLIAAAHLPFPGLGHLRANGAGWTYVPVNYSR